MTAINLMGGCRKQKLYYQHFQQTEGRELFEVLYLHLQFQGESLLVHFCTWASNRNNEKQISNYKSRAPCIRALIRITFVCLKDVF